jgi:tetratricopeptide (TPR) repeat protein
MTVKNLLFVMISACVLMGCASGMHHYYDSALNDRNRAPASIILPKTIGKDDDTIDQLNNQSRADFLFIQSELESNAGRGTETIELLRNALIYDPNSATIKQRLAIEYYKQGNIKQALDWAKSAYELNSTRRDLALLLAGLHTTLKNYSEAEAIYKTLVTKDAEDTEALLYLGAVYTEQKNYVRAIETFKALSGNINYGSRHLAYYYLARVYAEQKPKQTARIQEQLKKSVEIKPDFFESVSMMAQYIQQEKGLPAAIKYYENLQKTNGPHAKVAEVLAQYYISKNNFDKAFEQLEIIDDAEEGNVQAKLKMALILIEKKIYDRAVTKLNEILEIAPESDKVRFYLSAVYEEKKDFKKALEQYKKIEKDSSYFEESRLHAANILKQQGELEEAINHLKPVIELSAESPQSFIFMSQLYEEKKENQNALQVLEKATKKFSDNSAVFYYLGMLHDRLNMKPQMFESMKKVIEIEPDHAQAMNYIAYSWAEAGENLDKAETYARKAANKEKNDAYILDTLGWVMYKKGEYKKAIEILEKAHAMEPEVGIIAEHLGDVYLKMNMHEKARAKLLRAEQLESDVNRKKEIQQKLVSLEDQLKSSRVPSSVSADLRPQERP